MNEDVVSNPDQQVSEERMSNKEILNHVLECAKIPNYVGLATKLNVKPSVIYSISSGQAKLGSRFARTIVAKFSGVSYDWLMTGNKELTPVVVTTETTDGEQNVVEKIKKPRKNSKKAAIAAKAKARKNKKTALIGEKTALIEGTANIAATDSIAAVVDEKVIKSKRGRKPKDVLVEKPDTAASKKVAPDAEVKVEKRGRKPLLRTQPQDIVAVKDAPAVKAPAVKENLSSIHYIDDMISNVTKLVQTNQKLVELIIDWANTKEK
jgi:hypothetical protein